MAIRALPSRTNIVHWLFTVSNLNEECPILRSTFMKTRNDRWLAAVLKSTDPVFTSIACSRLDKQVWTERVWNEHFAVGRPFVRYVLICYPDGGRDLIIKMDHGLWDGTLLRLFGEHFALIVSGSASPSREQLQKFCLKHDESDKGACLQFWKRMIIPSPDIR